MVLACALKRWASMVTAAVTVSFIRYTEPKEWPVDRYPRLEALTRRLEQTPAFLAVPIDRE